MFRLRKKVAAQRVDLGGNAWIDVRPVTQFELDETSVHRLRRRHGVTLEDAR